MGYRKVTLPFETTWVVRTYFKDRARYHVVANQWASSPAVATIYRREEDAVRFIDDMRYYNRVGFEPGDVVEAVPLEGALLTSGTLIQVKPR